MNIRELPMRLMLSNSKLTTAAMISCSAVLTMLAAIAPTAAQAQSKPTVTVINPDTNPVNTRITNAVVPVEVSNAESITVQSADADLFTHVGQKPSRLVNLKLGFPAGPGDSGLRRVNPANGATEFFSIPDGFMLILTDINASVTCEPGADLRLVLGMERGDREDILGEICPSTGETSFERHYNTGLLFGAGSVLFSEMIGERLVIGIWAQGYLVPVE